MKKFWIIILLFIQGCCFLSINNCDEPQTENVSFENKGIFVTNEGNFTYGNASLSFVDFEKDTIYNSIFFNKTGYPIGDIAQSATIYNEKLFIVVNNSSKIIVIDKNNADYIGTVKGLSSPRYIQIISDTKAYVSDLYSNVITIFNPQTLEITGTINIHCNSETMIELDDYVYVCNWNNGRKIVKINTGNDMVADSLLLNKQPNSIVVDRDKKIWVLCDGGFDTDTNQNDIPAIYKIDPVDFTVLKKISFPNKRFSPSHLCINTNRDTIFFLNSSWSGQEISGGIYKMSVYDDNLPEYPLIQQEHRLFYSMAIIDDKIIVSDAIDFLQSGIVLIFDFNGNLLKSYRAGIIPGYFISNKS